jgi:hypothetical protein
VTNEQKRQFLEKDIRIHSLELEKIELRRDNAAKEVSGRQEVEI